MQQRNLIIAGAIVGGVLLVVVGFVIGRLTASSSEAPDAAPIETVVTTVTTLTTVTTAPDAEEVESQDPQLVSASEEFGDADSRSIYVRSVRQAMPASVVATDAELLARGDDVCANLEGFARQGRDVHYSIRVLWTELLRDMDSTEVATFGVVLSTSALQLCPVHIAFAADISYWLGI